MKLLKSKLLSTAIITVMAASTSFVWADSDFVTGAGWIVGTPSGKKASFGAASGIKNGVFFGHLNYVDHGNGMHVDSTAVTGYAIDPNDADCRIVDYNVTIDGQPGTARARLCDKGEPGENDIFQIQLSNGYFAGGDLGGDMEGGGNVQLHAGSGFGASSVLNDAGFINGGGWIVGTPSGAKANFGVAAGLKDGALWGHLNYIDHGNGMQVRSTEVTGYAVDPNDATCRIIDFNITIDGLPGTGRVRACDKGEPGLNDIFQIQLSNGYFAGGDLGGSAEGGGNLQLRQAAPFKALKLVPTLDLDAE